MVGHALRQFDEAGEYARLAADLTERQIGYDETAHHKQCDLDDVS